MAREYDDERVVIIERDGGNRLGMMLLGLAIGAGAALLFAPASGRETRERISREARRAGRRVKDVTDELGEKLADEAERARGVVDDCVGRARDAVGSRVQAVSDAVAAGREAAAGARAEIERAVADTKRAYADSRQAYSERARAATADEATVMVDEMVAPPRHSHEATADGHPAEG